MIRRMTSHPHAACCLLRKTLTSSRRWQTCYSTFLKEACSTSNKKGGAGVRRRISTQTALLTTTRLQSTSCFLLREGGGIRQSRRMASTNANGSMFGAENQGTASTTTNLTTTATDVTSSDGFDMLATTGTAEMSEELTTLTLANLTNAMTHLQDVIDALVVNSPPCPSIFVSLSTLTAVTANSMIPFLPVQPSVVATASQLGIWAYPICVTGQTLGGILAFSGARFAANIDIVKLKTKSFLKGANEQALNKLRHFKKLGSNSKESTQFVALMAIRLTPFFPFASGNYVLGSATGIGLRPFALATFLGCCTSQAASVGIGMGGAEIVKHALML